MIIFEQIYIRFWYLCVSNVCIKSQSRNPSEAQSRKLSRGGLGDNGVEAMGCRKKNIA